MTRHFPDTILLLAAVGLSFLWVNNPALSFYTLQLIGLAVLSFLVLNFLNRKGKVKPLLVALVNSVVLTIIILLIVLSTGSLSSPLFFLIYFLLFGIAWSLGPLKSGVLSCALVLFFAFEAKSSFENFVALLSIFLITPLSLFFGWQYLKILHQKGEIKILQKLRRREEEDIINEETDVLMWLSLNFSPMLTKIVDLLSQVLSNPSLPAQSKEQLKETHQLSKKILESGEYLKEKVDIQTDD